MRGAVATLLSADATLLALLTGGIHGGADEISRQETPTAFDANGELRPCLLIKDSTLTPDASTIPGAARHVLRLFYYQPAGVATIAAARARVYALLHRQRVTVSGVRVIELDHLGDLLGQPDDALGCQVELSRWEAALTR